MQSLRPPLCQSLRRHQHERKSDNQQAKEENTHRTYPVL